MLKTLPPEKTTGCAFFDSLWFTAYMNSVDKAKVKGYEALESSDVMKWILKFMGMNGPFSMQST